MIRFLSFLFLAVASAGAQTNEAARIGLSDADLERLGVVLQPAAAVTQIEVASGPASTVIPPAQQAIVSSTVDGMLARLLVAEGDFVTAGQALAEITSADILSLQHDYMSAAASFELAGAQLERDRGLHAEGIIAERRLLESRAARRIASTERDQLRQQLALAGMTATAIDRLEQTGELSPTLTLGAPFDSVVIEQLAGLVSRIDALDAVYRVADLSTLWLEVRVPQERARNIEPGMRVLATAGGNTLEAQVSHVGRVVDSSSQTVLVRAIVENEDLSLRAGQFLNARILDTGGRQGPVFEVPNTAIVRVDGNAFVFADSAGEVASLPVEIVAEGESLTYIRAELDAGDRVAVAGVAALKSVWLEGQAEGEE